MIDGRKLKNVAASPSRVTVCCETCVGARDQPDVIGKEIRSAWSCKEGWHGMVVLQSKQGSNAEAHTAASECVHYSSCCFTARTQERLLEADGQQCTVAEPVGRQMDIEAISRLESS